MFAKALYWSQNRILSALHLKLFSNNYTIIIFFSFLTTIPKSIQRKTSPNLY